MSSPIQLCVAIWGLEGFPIKDGCSGMSRVEDGLWHSIEICSCPVFVSLLYWHWHLVIMREYGQSTLHRHVIAGYLRCLQLNTTNACVTFKVKECFIFWSRYLSSLKPSHLQREISLAETYFKHHQIHAGVSQLK